MSDAKTPPRRKRPQRLPAALALTWMTTARSPSTAQRGAIAKIKTGESSYLRRLSVVRRRRTAVPAGQQQPRTADREVVRHRGRVTIPGHLPRRFHTRQSAFGSGIPSLVENRASSWVDSPAGDALDRSEEHVGQIRQRHRPAIDEARDRVQVVVHASHKLFAGVASTFPCRIACWAVGGVILPGCVRSGTAAASPAAKTRQE